MAIRVKLAVRFDLVGSESTPRGRVAETQHTDGDHPITDREGASRADRHGAELERGAIVGEYQIERKLGHGGMGSVYEAIHPVIEKRVAIKVLLPELSRNEEAVERFKSEARAVNRIRHPSIVDVFGYGTTEDGRCFLVMELLDGESLGRRLQYDPPGIAEACDILIAITHALDAAHATGIVHRDLKPDNVFLVEHKHVKLLDFGIAKLTARPEGEAVSTEYTQPGQAMGTPRYIAPEQARGDAVDGRTDIYSLGVMAFELLAGRLPFVGDNAMELIAKHITLPPPTPSDLAPTLPPEADKLLLQMLDKEPANRPSLSTIRAMLDEIRAPWVTSVTNVRPVVKPPVESVTEAPRRKVAPVETTTDPEPKRSWMLPIGIGLALAACVTTFVVIRSLKSTEPEQLVAPTTPPPAAGSKPETKVEAPKPPESAPSKPAPEAKLEPPPEPAKAPEPAKPAPEIKPPTAKPTAPRTVNRSRPAPASTPTPQPVAPTPVPQPEPPKPPESRDGLMRPKLP